jgi:tetratricopeptide (TPR) repeat protein
MGGLSFTYWAQQRQARMARAELAMAEAGRLRDEAVKEPDNDEKWLVAERGIAEAARAIADAGRSEATERLAAMRDHVHAGREAARRDRKLLDALYSVRSSKQDLRHSGTDARYTEAFREAGLDIDGAPAEEIAAKLRVQPAVVLDSVVAALDDWALERRAGKQPVSRWRRPLEAARAADPDGYRDRVRTALLNIDSKAREKELRNLATAPEAAKLPPPSAVLLASALRDLKAYEPAVALLRAVTGRHPRDVWANYELAAMIREFQPTHLEEAARYYTAARALQPETAHDLAHLLLEMRRDTEAFAIFDDLVQLPKHDSRDLICYGIALSDRLMKESGEILQRAETEARTEVQLNPDDALAHRNLGSALRILGKYDEAVFHLSEAIRLEPDDPSTHVWLAVALSGQGKMEESIAVLRETIRLKPDYPEAHSGLAGVFDRQAKPDAALAEAREAIRLKPEEAKFHIELGLRLATQQRFDDAIAEFRTAQRLNPEYPTAHCSLGMVVYGLGDYAMAASELRKGDELRSKLVGEPFTPNEQIIAFDKVAAQAARLPAVVEGSDRPRNADEFLFFADGAYKKKLYGACVRLYDDALSAQPGLTEDRQRQHRYNAACAAALAAAGQGVEKPAPEDRARTNLRRQAIAWLNVELDAWTKILECGKAKDFNVAFHLNHWTEDSDLASIRDPESLAKLPECERELLRKLWARVDALLAKARKETR